MSRMGVATKLGLTFGSLSHDRAGRIPGHEEADESAFGDARRDGCKRIARVELCQTAGDKHSHSATPLLSPQDGAARKNMLSALADVRPTHLLDRDLREACGLHAASGELLDSRGETVAHRVYAKPDASSEQ